MLTGTSWQRCEGGIGYPEDLLARSLDGWKAGKAPAVGGRLCGCHARRADCEWLVLFPSAVYFHPLKDILQMWLEYGTESDEVLGHPRPDLFQFLLRTVYMT